MMRKIVVQVLIGTSAGLLGAFLYVNFINPIPVPGGPSLTFAANNQDDFQEVFPAADIQFFGESQPRPTAEIPTTFAKASAETTNSVVFVKTVSHGQKQSQTWLDVFFEGGSQERIGSGSGIIYGEDGFILTNNHVIDGASTIEIIHNKRVYEAKLIGTDPNTDLAVLKVNTNGLPAIKIGSSRKLQVGDWVLAVGNPFNLTSTVTAGIVSAKGRDINILRSKFPIESFIQTDAAINPGNSGGALVNIKGELVGVNSAILSKTGSYSGYGFAVPVDIARKVANDIIKYGEVQKAFLGAQIKEISPEFVDKDDGIVDRSGVRIQSIQRDGAAFKAGLKVGDILLKIGNDKIENQAAFDEAISYYNPGQHIKVYYKRNDRVFDTGLTFTNKEGRTGVTRKQTFTSRYLGAEFESVPKVEKDLYEIEAGLRILRIIPNSYISSMGLQKEDIIVSMNSNPVNHPKDIIDVFENNNGKVVAEIVNKSGRKFFNSYRSN